MFPRAFAKLVQALQLQKSGSSVLMGRKLPYIMRIVRYSTRTGDFSLLDIPRFYMFNLQNATDPTLFNSQLGNSLANLSPSAAADSSRLAFGSTRYMDSLSIYAMLQCTKDITGNDCLNCLQSILSYIPQLRINNKIVGRIFPLSCNFRYETYSFFQLTSPEAPPPPSPPIFQLNSTTTTEHSTKKSSKTIVILVAVVAVVLSLILIHCGCFFWKKDKRQRAGNLVHYVNEDGSSSMESLLIGLNKLRVATRNFSDAHKLGQGGFGPVYKGKLDGGREIAVKRLSKSSGQGLEELKSEVILVSKLLHRNLVRLLGFCLEEREKLLVYEYLPNGSLDKILFDQARRFSLQWEGRYKIIVGIARGLLYLHEDSQLRIIHRDLKSSNILLDEHMNPKISDFGLAKLFSGSQTQGDTNPIAGTYGYMAPEYAKKGLFSTKSDVYSFGILVLEIVTGPKNSGCHNFSNLQSYAWEHWTIGTALELPDPTMGDQWSKHKVLKCIHIGLLCVQEAVVDRPSMSEIVMMLSSYTITSPSPLQPAFFISRGNQGSNLAMEDFGASQLKESKLELPQQSINDVSITELSYTLASLLPIMPGYWVWDG
ncbi:hypothetical protein P3X46_012207 [Hevea brasiliensis]|uniref:Cysteine-rich receptor-like protein kinase 10 n=1 Tax=Hevea brasiliensis TaxID=3981 RepID=A0ABQ9MDD3_HEVBR|nr:hypothetical protein P3X46_012207 [Hevea brasiliensis]